MDPELDSVSTYLDSISKEGKDLIFVVSKLDLLGGSKQEHFTAEIAGRFSSEVRFVSSVTLEGIHEVASELANRAERRLSRKPGEVVLTQLEHVRAVESCLSALTRAEAAFDLVLFATDIRHGMNDLGPLIGETLPDDVLGKIFSDFCINPLM
jgi:tRNA modification GTPase